MMQPLLIAEKFGMRDYGRIFAAHNFLTMFGVASGPAVIGMLYSFFDGYGAAYLVMSCASLVAFGFYLMTNRSLWGRL